MSDHTTIALQDDTKEMIDEDKPDGMSYDLYVKQLYRNAKAYENQD